MIDFTSLIMKLFKLESLPKITIVEVFSYVRPEELLDYRFLNKDLFNTIENIIKVHLNYSTYFETDSFVDVQDDFIRKNSSTIKHLTIPNDSLFDYSQMDDTMDTFFAKFEALESLNILVRNSLEAHNITKILTYFKDIIFKIKRIELISCYHLDLDLLFSLLDRDRITYFGIFKKGISLTLEHIIKFQEFKKLETLELNISDVYNENDDVIDVDASIFPRLEKLVLKGDEYLNVNFTWFGNMGKLKYLELGLLKYETENIQFIKNKETLEKVKLNYFFYLETHIEIEHILDSINVISEVKSCKILEIEIMDEEEGYKEYNGNEYLFKYIQEIILISSCMNIQFIFIFLKNFPNVEKVTLKVNTIRNNKNQPLLLSDNYKDILFCIDNDSLNCSDCNILDLLASINTIVMD